MKLQYEDLPIKPYDEYTHVRDLSETDRRETNLRLQFITAMLGKEALRDVNLGVGSDYDLVA
jgi:hypothetical protein